MRKSVIPSIASFGTKLVEQNTLCIIYFLRNSPFISHIYTSTDLAFPNACQGSKFGTYYIHTKLLYTIIISYKNKANYP